MTEARPRVGLEGAFAALASLHAGLERRLNRLHPRCEASGRCCDFPTSGHILYATMLEVDYLLHVRGASEIPFFMDLCPFHRARLCHERTGRPLACRIFFCDPSYRSRMPEIYERYHASLRRLHSKFDIPYRYGPFLSLLRERLDGQREANRDG